MDKIAYQSIEINPDELKITEALHAVTTLTEGEINADNIAQSEDSLWNLFNSILSPQLKIFILILFMAYFGMSPEEVQAQTVFPDNVTPISEPILTKTTVSNLRLRAEPHLNGDIITELLLGQEVKVFGYAKDTEDWAFVDKDGDEQPDGFVFTDFLALDGFTIPSNATMNNIEMFGVSCGASGGTANDSAERLCAFPHAGGMIYYAHNYTRFGKTISELSNNIGAKVSVYSDGNFLGEYEVISSHQASGTDISSILSSEALNGTNYQYITFVTTNKAKEDVDRYARTVVTLVKIQQ